MPGFIASPESGRKPATPFGIVQPTSPPNPSSALSPNQITMVSFTMTTSGHSQLKRLNSPNRYLKIDKHSNLIFNKNILSRSGKYA